jgi:hypothetical protein
MSCYWTGNHTQEKTLSYGEWTLVGKIWTKLILQSNDTFDSRIHIMYCEKCNKTFKKTVYRNRNLSRNENNLK